MEVPKKLTIKKYPLQTKFEAYYIKTRQSENRIISAEQIRQLPKLQYHSQAKEWQQRQKSTQRLLDKIAQNPQSKVLDLGCGNGWLGYKLAFKVKQYIGVEVNETELLQAAEVLAGFENVDLILGDIFKIPFEEKFDIVIINAVIQYFPKIESLLEHLLTLLTPSGTIQIVDSPFYAQSTVVAARQRSLDYYQKVGTPEMINFYFHHTWESLEKFNYKVLYNPNNWREKVKRKIGVVDSPFPWIEIRQ